MASNEKIVAIDIGATSIKLCQFEYDSNGDMILDIFAYREYEEELSEGSRIGVVSGVLRQMLAENKVYARKALISMSGQSALLRFGKIPASSGDRKQLLQLAEFEAKRNIPFEISEVMFDYQLIMGSEGESDDMVDVMSVVIKNDIVEQFTSAVLAVGLEPILVDVAPVACYNTVRANGLGQDECVAVLNIGGRSTNLIFVEGERFFARTIPIAGYSITQQIAKEFGISSPDAEELKRHHGFVALGGAYAEPSSETAAAVSKIIRNVMARLHGEISRSIAIYKSQQKGGNPVKMYLTGGSSILTYCDTFFSEKLNIPVEYFNPFSVVNLDDGVDKDKLSEVAHMFSETIGLGMRYRLTCPIEINLLPMHLRRQQNLTSKKPFFIASMIVVLLILAAFWQGLDTQGRLVEESTQKLEKLRKPYEQKLKAVQDAESAAQQKVEQYKTLSNLLLERTVFPSIINEIYRLKPDDVWLTSIRTQLGEMKEFEPTSVVNTQTGSNNPMDMMGMGGDMMMMDGPMGMDMMGMGGMGAGADGKEVNVEKSVKISGFTLIGVCVTPDKSGRVAITETPKIKFPFAVPETASEEGQGGEAGEEGQAKGKPSAGDTPENVFVERLRQSKLFSSNPKLTVLTSSKPSDVAKNAGSFTIQLALETPLEYLQYGTNDIR